MSLLPALEKETRANPDSAVIWLHGLGADGHDFAPIVEQLRLPAQAAIRFIFPHAPSLPVTVNGGFIMPAWYDVYDMQIERRVDRQGILRSAEAVARFVEREREAGIEPQRIVIAGFSQGGAVAYQLALSHPSPLGGLLAMSTYLATADSLAYSQANASLPIAIQHGTHDPIVPVALGRQASETLRARGYEVEYTSYPMEHAVCPQQIADIAQWLRRVLQLGSS